MKFFIKVNQTHGDDYEYNVLYIDLTPEKILEIQGLQRLCQQHELSEVRRTDYSPRLFLLENLPDQEDISPEEEAAFMELVRKAEEAFARGGYWSRPGDDFELPRKTEAEHPNVISELVCFNDRFFWKFTHRKSNQEWESEGLNQKHLQEALEQQCEATRRVQVSLAALTRQSWDGEILVPVDWTIDQVQEKLEALEDHVAGEYVDDNEYWERGTCTAEFVEPKIDSGEPDFIFMPNGDIVRVKQPKLGPE